MTRLKEPVKAPAGQCCPLCGGTGELLGEKDGVPVRECRCVGRALLCWAWESEAQYAALYTDLGAYHIREQQREGQEPSAGRDTEHLTASVQRLRHYRLLLPEASYLLDVGCGTGALVAAAAAFGFQAYGIEPARECVSRAQQMGREVERGGWQEARGVFDLVTLHDVLEHLADPQGCLEWLGTRLTEDGAIAVEIPDWGAGQPCGLEWKHLRPRQHLWLPDEPAARALFARAGLEVEALWRPRRGALDKITYLLARV